FYLLLIGFFMSLATRIKSGRLLKNTLIWIILSRIGRLFRWIGRHLRDFIHAVPLVQKTVLWVSILFWGNLILGLLLFIGSTGVLFWLLVLVECLVLGGVAIRYALSLRRLQSGAHKIASGELDHQVDTAHMPHDCRTSAEDLNHIGAGLSKAVDERLKSERFKTELITNVSHDIKTPLTSIINYVDLIKKSEPEDPTLRSYVEILDRQSNRLKKLIEDLVEASKASSGVLPVTLTPCALGVLLEQVEGEYAEKLAARELTLVVTKPADTLTIQADQRHLGRIFDNLMNNILKYAQPGTRVYLDASPDREGQAVITFRNTSGAPLNIPAEELMERFVRGDASRHTEGSGLGLSIVQSLTELQGGHMHLTIDGDLFKVRLVFPAAATRPAFTVQDDAPDSTPSGGQNQDRGPETI
ncbi:MAG: sensor histidine kinase, partial [Eubacteriales bacterium]